MFTNTIPLGWDEEYIYKKSSLDGAKGFYINNGVKSLHYTGTPEQFEEVCAIIDNYPTTYADEVVKPRMCKEVTDLRWIKQQSTIYNGIELECDDITIGRLTSGAFLMDVNPDTPQERRWKLADDNWITLSKQDMIELGSVIAAHMQTCFNREEELHNAIKSAETIEDLALIDIEDGWND